MIYPFCDIPASDRVIDTDLLFGFFVRLPVSPGHFLLVPRRHVEIGSMRRRRIGVRVVGGR